MDVGLAGHNESLVAFWKLGPFVELLFSTSMQNNGDLRVVWGLRITHVQGSSS